MKKRRSAPLLGLLLILCLSPFGKALSGVEYRTMPEVVAAPFVFEEALPSSWAVGSGWFSDAVFIGDARLQELTTGGLFQPGLSLAQTGLNLRDLRNGSPFFRNGQRTSLEEMLQEGSYRKVYLMLGFNEAAWMDQEEFSREYAGLISDLRGMLPEAEIYVQTLIPVTVSRSTARAPDNELLASCNILLAHLAREKQVYLLDVGSYFIGPSGALTSTLSTDGLHLTEEGNALWFQYLCTHTMG